MSDSEQSEADHELFATGRLFLLFDYFRSYPNQQASIGEAWASRYGLEISASYMPDFVPYLANDVALPGTVERELLPLRNDLPRARLVDAFEQARTVVGYAINLANIQVAATAHFGDRSLSALENASHALWIRRGRPRLGPDTRARLAQALEDLKAAAVEATDLDDDTKRILLAYVEALEKALTHLEAFGPDGLKRVWNEFLGKMTTEPGAYAKAKRSSVWEELVAAGAVVTMLFGGLHQVAGATDDFSRIISNVTSIAGELEAGPSAFKTTDEADTDQPDDSSSDTALPDS